MLIDTKTGEVIGSLVTIRTATKSFESFYDHFSIHKNPALVSHTLHRTDRLDTWIFSNYPCPLSNPAPLWFLSPLIGLEFEFLPQVGGIFECLSRNLLDDIPPFCTAYKIMLLKLVSTLTSLCFFCLIVKYATSYKW